LYLIIGANQSNLDINYTYNEESDKLTFDEIKLSGYTFAGWYTDANMSTSPFDETKTTLSSVAVDNTIHLYAKFAQKEEFKELCKHITKAKIIQEGSCKDGTNRIEQTYCSLCGQVFDTREYAVEHDFVGEDEYVWYAPTCTQKGYYVQKCRNCDTKLIFEYADKIDHKIESVVTLEPTCTTEGLKENKCIYCGNTFGTEPIEALGHSYYSIGVFPSTCSTHGYEEFVCERCGEQKRGEDLPFDPNAHSFVKDEKTGLMICGGCGILQSEVEQNNKTTLVETTNACIKQSVLTIKQNNNISKFTKNKK